MSRASRLANADSRIQPPRDPKTGHFVSRSLVPGARGFELDEPVVACGIAWDTNDGLPTASPIGAALAFETVTRG